MANVMEVWIESREEILKNARWSDKCGGGGSDKGGGGSDKGDCDIRLTSGKRAWPW